MTVPTVSRFRVAPATAAVLTAACGLFAEVAQAGPVFHFGEDDQSSLQINYALQLWAENRSYTSANHEGSSTDTYLRRNRLTFFGQYNDVIGYYVQLEATGDSRGGVDDRDVFYRDAYLTFDFRDEVRFIAGRFKNTFSRENLEACLEPLTIDRSDISYTPFAGTRDTGVAIWGNLADAAFQYRLAIMDGREGENVPQKAPRVTARVHWSPLDPEFDYGYRGTYLGTQRVFTIGAAYDYQADAAYANYTQLSNSKDYKAWTVDGFAEYPFSSGTYTVSGAYFNYSLGNAINEDPDPTLPVNTELEGFYVKAAYLLPSPVGPGRLQFFARHNGSEYQLPGGALDRRINAAGFNYYLNGQQLKLTLEHQRIDYANPNPTNPVLQDNFQTILGLQFIL
ncbi:selenite/tellurite reduction operon porin ExtI [Hydrocarboniphaga effusa]|jgi:hypothetical protein|uniref:Phosphate-selective porin O and P n=1 Tax=Hydrocarboniphaga effusa AP103 TaxID=1172194 RepID=I8TAU2_9GAMM|nr:phosphate-selective porin O and P [Hydrocarboniphaga effusa AP103]